MALAGCQREGGQKERMEEKAVRRGKMEVKPAGRALTTSCTAGRSYCHRFGEELLKAAMLQTGECLPAGRMEGMGNFLGFAVSLFLVGSGLCCQSSGWHRARERSAAYSSSPSAGPLFNVLRGMALALAGPGSRPLLAGHEEPLLP